ncbi:MAG: sigma-70 family RNA polymerase sigma factor [Phycisphaerales bacterium]|nr:sigma-70 family RNA polymerase sigma factor [Phycisphaerales bacterium]
MSDYNAIAMTDLAAQLLRSPSRLRLRQLSGIEFLLSIIDAERSYPMDFVIHAITGYRSNGPESTIVNGGDLVTDLTSLAEELSGASDILVETWPTATYSVNELADRFDVSTKTIFRWRKRGLIGWRFRCADRRARVAFPERCVRRFVAQNAELVSRGSSFSQLSRDEKTQIVGRARELADAGEKTVNAVARIIAVETNRAVETIRLILKQYDDARPNAGVFNRSRLKVAADDKRLQVWEAHCDGASATTLAKRFDESVDWVYRAVTEMRARDIKSRPVEYVPSDEFTLDNAEALCMTGDAADYPYADATPPKRVPRDLPPYLRQLFHLPLLSPEGERALFRKMNYLRFKADEARQAIEPERATAAELDRVEELVEKATAVKNQITKANLRLVVSIAKRHLSPKTDFFEIISDGNVSLMRAVDRFDYSRGFKFSTYGSWAIMKNFARTLPEKRLHGERYQTGRDELLDRVSGPSWDEAEDDFTPVARARIAQMLGTLDEREQEILRQRFGIDNGGQALTLEQIGTRFGVSKERIRQLESRALNRLREDFAADVKALLG